MDVKRRPHLRTANAAHYIGVSRSALAKWRMNREGPLYHRCGRRIIYYYQDEIDEWLAECDKGRPAAKSRCRRTR
jgi:predicted DNA-binding transcriptional regulator AlpA